MSKDDKELITDYFINQNRPYSAIDILNNLHKQIGKAAVAKALDLLVEDGTIKEKLYGKQKVYVYDQNRLPEVNNTELREMDAKIRELQGHTQLEIREMKRAEAELKLFQSALSTEEAEAELQRLNKTIEEKSQKLEDFKENCPKISYEERDLLLKNRDGYLKEWRKRKRITIDIVNTILEGYPKSKKDFLEETGVETDEDLGCKMPDK